MVSQRRLVIDPSIARAAGGVDAVFPTSKICRDTLSEVLTIGHQLVMTTDLRDEWRRHQSRFARTWLVSMYARRKVHTADDVSRNESLRLGLIRTAELAVQRAAILKDCHLVEAALATDRAILSLDERMRALLHRAAASVEDLQQVAWVNPTNAAEGCSEWLHAGAEPERWRCLGSE